VIFRPGPSPAIRLLSDLKINLHGGAGHQRQEQRGGFGIVEFDSNDFIDGGFFIDEVGLFGTGPTLYTGPESAPIFRAGDFLVSTESLTGTAAVPEPSTWAMMLIGFAGLGYASRRASRKSAAVAA
jgi:PEP-CTERM motif